MREKRVREASKIAEVINLDADVPESIKAPNDAWKRKRRSAAPPSEPTGREAANEDKISHGSSAVERVVKARPSKKSKTSKSQDKPGGRREEDEAGPSNRGQAPLQAVAAVPDGSARPKGNPPPLQMTEAQKRKILKRNAKFDLGLTHEFKDPEAARLAAILRKRYAEVIRETIEVDVATGSVFGPRPEGLEIRGGKRFAWARNADGTYRPIHIKQV
jgi:hypothetical protein